MAANTRLRNRIVELQQQKEHEREWWDKHRETTKQEFMKELESEGIEQDASRKGSVAGSSDGEPVFVEGGGPSSQTVGGKKKKKGKK